MTYNMDFLFVAMILLVLVLSRGGCGAQEPPA